MGSIQSEQSNLLQGGTEQITYKVFNSEGVYIRTDDENILIKAPRSLKPIGGNLVIERERPLKKVEFVTDLKGIFFKNQNANFINGDSRYIISSYANKTLDVRSDTNETVDALTGGKYFFCNDIDELRANLAMIAIDQQYDLISQGKPLEIGFNYFIKTTDEDEKYELNVMASLDETYAGTGELKIYNFKQELWNNYPTSPTDEDRKLTQTSTVNTWSKLKISVKQYDSSSVDTDVFVTVQINLPKLIGGGSGNFQAIYIDNFYIGETNDTVNDKLISKRTQFPVNGIFSGEHKNEKNTISNVAKSTDYFIGKYEGTFKRLRDSTAKALEQIVTAEMLNDYRNYLSRYEGTFQNISIEHIGLHNKVHIDYGGETYQDPVSCYIDAMKYDVKAAEYDMTLHMPNQNNDTTSSYVNIFD
tara:strand:+ start:1491 stop:2741 length:1251 start_codon:yes stop_codon:yes gene_type:complete